MHMRALLNVRISALVSVRSVSAHLLGTLAALIEVVRCSGGDAFGKSSNEFDGCYWKRLGHGRSRPFGAAVVQFALAGAMRACPL